MTDPAWHQILLATALSAVTAGLMTSLLVPPMVRLARSLHAIDEPGQRRSHAGAVPRLGGIAIFFGLAFGAGMMAMTNWPTWGFAVGRSELVAFAFGVLMVFITGVVDDLEGVSTLKKFLIEIVAATPLVLAGWSFSTVSLPGGGNLELGIWGQIISLVWIVGVTNAINLIDGLDGLAAGVVAIISGSLLVMALLQGNLLTTILLAATCGACIGFLRHNWSPAQIYLGDSGSLTLGFIVATVSVHSSLKAPAAVAILVPLLALGVPVIDTLLVMGVRFLERPKGKIASRFLRMFVADRNHLHHVIEGLAPRRQAIVGSIYALVLASCGLALLVAVTRNAMLGIAVLAVEVVVIGVVRWLGLRSRRGSPEAPATEPATRRNL
jgi:UDP-GlcNAc:undecaprenyl-phosphate GlcNAc-1-phosphate transferase